MADAGDIVDRFGGSLSAADRDKVFIGAVVVIKGLFKARTVAGLIVKIHPAGVMMTDVDGEESAWSGRLPIIDAIIVDAKTQFNAAQPTLSTVEGTPMHIAKVPWATDIETRASWKGMPPMIIETAPRYIVIGELSGQ